MAQLTDMVSSSKFFKFYATETKKYSLQFHLNNKDKHSINIDDEMFHSFYVQPCICL